MNRANGEPSANRGVCVRWGGAVFAVVLGAQLLLVALAGTDIPFQDQWNVEGRWLYPTWREGHFRIADLLRPGNENRMVWTLVLDLALFELNGQWDPLVQLAANSFIRAACAAGLAALLLRCCSRRVAAAVATAIAIAFLPHPAWHNALWAIESHAYFALGFGLLTFALLEPASRSRARTLGGFLAGVAALVAMSPAALVPVALLGLALLRARETREWGKPLRHAWPAFALLALALILRVHVPEHDALRASTVEQYLGAAGRLLAWPHAGQPLAAIPLNLPLVLLVAARAQRRRQPSEGEDLVLLAGAWGFGVALAAAWTRGGSDELRFGVPSRYVDFLVLLPLANAWAVFVLTRERVKAAGRSLVRWLSTAWAAFLLLGWLGLSVEVMRGIVLPRARDRDAPVRLMQAYQRRNDEAVFAGQPRLLVPSPNLKTVRDVLIDPRMRGALPPSLQATEPQGPLSRAVRFLLGRQ